MFGKLKTKILKMLYGSVDKQLMNATMKDVSEAINHRRIVVWGVNQGTEKIINWYRDKIFCIVDSSYKKRRYCGINVISPQNLLLERPDEFCFLLLGNYECAISFLKCNNQNVYFAPSIVEKPKHLLTHYRRIKRFFIEVSNIIKRSFIVNVVKRCSGWVCNIVRRFSGWICNSVKKVLHWICNSVKKVLHWICNVMKKVLHWICNVMKNGFSAILGLPYVLLFDRLTSPQMRIAFASLTYKIGREAVKKQSWRKFNKAAKNKNVILFGYCKLTEEYIFSNKFKHRIKAVYDFSRFLNHEIYGYKIQSPAKFKYNDKEDIILICHFSMPDVVAAMTFFEEQGIKEYYNFTAMEAKRFKYLFCRPAYLLKCWIGKMRTSNGLIRNYILFPLKAILRVCHIPYFYKPYKELLDLKNKFKGKRCFIVGTGPSLNIEDIEKLRHEYTFGVNRIFQVFDKTDWRPTFYALCDPKAIAIYQSEHKKLNFDDFCMDTSFITDYSRKDVDKLRQSRVQYIPMCYLDHFCSGIGHHYKYSKNLIYGSYNAQTVVNYCINIAQYLGFSEIYLLGVDCNYSVTNCYMDGASNPSVNTIQLAALTNKLMMEGYGFIKRKMDKLGVRVYNASRAGRLDVFPRINFDTLFTDEAGAYDYERMPDGSKNPLTVSVNMITYGHEKYIRKALDSILMQKTKFKYEINIGEDCSPDNTRDILLEYKEKYPDIIQLKLRDENIGMMKNAYDLFINAKGKYVAYLEGDDYWTTPDKLQMQVDFLEAHQEYIGCSTGCDTIDENDRYTNILQYWDARKTLYTLKDLGKRGLCGLDNSLVHRNIFLDKKVDYSVFLTENTSGDRFTQFFLLCHGDLFRFPDKTLCYRRLNSPKLKNAMSQMAQDRHIFLMFYRIELKLQRMAKKQFGKKYVSKDSKRLLFEAVKSLCKYPEKGALKEYIRLFWHTPNKIRFAYVSIRAVLYCIWKKGTQHYGVVSVRRIGRNQKNILTNGNFSKIKCEPRDWKIFRLPGEEPIISFSSEGAMFDSRYGNVRYRQMLKSAEKYKNKWITFSVKLCNSFDGKLRLFIIGDNNAVIEHAEFMKPDANKVIFMSKKIPKDSVKLGVQIMTEGDGILIIEYAKLELGKSPTLII